jgi:hypothetical protein
MVIAGGDFHDGLLSVALKLAGQSADVVMAARLVFPEPPAGAGFVVEVEAEVVVVVDVLAVFEDEEPKIL